MKKVIVFLNKFLYFFNIKTFLKYYTNKYPKNKVVERDN